MLCYRPVSKRQYVEALEVVWDGTHGPDDDNDLLSGLGSTEKVRPRSSSGTRAVILAALASGPMTAQSIAARSGLGLDRIAAMLGGMCVAGEVVAEPLPARSRRGPGRAFRLMAPPC